MKKFTVKLLTFLGTSLFLLLIGAAFCYGIAWVVKWLALDYLVKNGVVDNVADFWEFTQIFYVLIMMPPIYMMIFKASPTSIQDNIKGAASGASLAILYLGDWIGKGILLAFGAYLFYTAFAI